MRALLLTLVLVLVAFTGCFEASPLMTPDAARGSTAASFEAAPTHASTFDRNTTSAFDVPAGDAYGLLWVQFREGDGFTWGGNRMYGLTVDSEALGESGFLLFSAYYVESGEARWAVSYQGLGGGGSVAIGGETPPSVLFVIATHAERASTLRVAQWTDLEAIDFPADTVPGTWTAAGPAEVSYHWSSQGEVVGQGVTTEDSTVIPVPVGEAGAHRVESTHDGAGTRLVHASSTVFALAGAGSHDVAWTMDGEEEAFTIPFADPFTVTGHTVTGSFEGPSANAITVTGARVFPVTMFSHVSANVDVASLGLEIPTHAGVIGPEIAVGPPGVCHRLVETLCGPADAAGGEG